MTPQQQQRLFACFSQVDASISRKYGGTGLGLSICKQLVEMMGGRIGVDSQAGEGSTFWCEIPLCVAAAGEMQQRGIPDELKSLRVLAVDDTPTNLEILRDQLHSWGFAFAPAADAGSALESMRKSARQGRPFQLAILDQHLPDMDGLDLAAAIKDDPLLRDTPLLMLTSVDFDMGSEQTRKVGLAGLLTKPIRQSRLFDAIVDVMQHSSGQGPRHGSPSATAGEPNATGARAAAGNVLIVEDNEINRMVTGEILSNAGFHYDLACDGREAVDALKQKCYDVVLMDCQMPRMDGFEATREIRRLEIHGTLEHCKVRSRIAIVALTANAVQGDRDTCLAAGMDDYITKPINRNQVLAVLEAHLPKPAAATTPVAQPEPAVVIDVDDLLERCSGNRRFAGNMLRKFRASIPGELAQIKAAVSAADSPTARRVVHTLRGTAGNLSARCLHRVAEEIETLIKDDQIDAVHGNLVHLETEVDRLFASIDGLLNDWDGNVS